MALAKVTDAFQGITEKIVVEIPSAGHRDHGMWVDGASTPHDLDAVVQPMGDNEVNKMNPDGDTADVHLKFYIDIEKFPIDIQVAHDSKSSVTVVYNQQRFKVLSIKNYGTLGGFRSIYTVQLRKEN